MSTSSKLATPAAPPPAGVTPNPDDPQTLHTEMHIILVVTWTLMTVPLAVRLFARWYVAKVRAIEDYFIIVAWVLGITNGIVCMMCTKHGAGIHMWDQDKATFEGGQTYIKFAGLIYGPLVTFVKIAVLMQCIRTFAPHPMVNQPMFLAGRVSIITTILFYSVLELLLGIHCLPFINDRRVINTAHIFVASSIFNLVSDSLVLILSVVAICRLRMSLKEKALIASLFVAGPLACIATISRMYFSIRIGTGQDPSWNYALLGISSWFEVSLGVVVLCLPVLPMCFRYAKANITGLELKDYLTQRGSTTESA